MAAVWIRGLAAGVRILAAGVFVLAAMVMVVVVGGMAVGAVHGDSVGVGAGFEANLGVSTVF